MASPRTLNHAPVGWQRRWHCFLAAGTQGGNIVQAPKTKAAAKRRQVVAEPCPVGKCLDELRVAAAENDIVNGERLRQRGDCFLDCLAPLLLTELLQAAAPERFA